ncbi:ESPR-type extended signal peptide-containing protein [Veillonella criceti]|uniref:Outer membrane protein alpha n=1 Tax=Veillonella criceti TaxID=103891 RepID=A0A380NMG4_9FIRM|nr:ESPR-type extended signal peptide-containing protein [Veillonella criceti]SUP44389.1 Outer membrane protein alpha precursor [Veillonella criceti]
MNKVYKVIWSRTKGCYVVASEFAKRHTKSSATSVSRVALASLLVAGVLTSSVYAAEDNIVVADGKVGIGYTTSANGNQSIAIGSEATARTKSSIAIGEKATVGPVATNSIAIGGVVDSTGVGNTVNSAESIALGVGNIINSYQGETQGTSNLNRENIAIGKNNIMREHGEQVNNPVFGNVVMGTNNVMYGQQSVAIGYKTTVSNTSSVAIGHNTEALRANTIAIGQAHAKSTQSIAIGMSSTVEPGSGDGIALGASARVEQGAVESIAIGPSARAQGKNGTALGSYAFTYADNGVAIGTASQAVRSGGTSIGYDPMTGKRAAITGDNPTWKGTHGAVSVGGTTQEFVGLDENNTPQYKRTYITRQITNVAAGEYNTDAVNVAQLKRVDLKTTADVMNPANPSGGGVILNSERLKLTGGATGEVAANNIKTTITSDRTEVKIELAKDVNLTESGSVSFGAPQVETKGQSTTPVTGLNKDGLTIVGTTTDKDGTTQALTTTKIGADKIVVNGQEGKDGNPATGVVIGKQDVTPSIKQADGITKPGEAQTGNYVTGLDNTKWNPEEKGIVESRAATEGQLKDAVDGIVDGTGENATGGFGLTADNQVDGKPVEVRQDLGKTIQIAGDGQNISTTADPTSGKITVGLTNDLSIGGPAGKDGKDGVDGKIGVKGKDGLAGVSINGADGSIGLTGPKGADGKAGVSITIKGEKGQPGVEGVTGQNGKDGLTRIVYEDEAGTPHQVATLEDGQKYAGDNGQSDATKVINKKLNEQLDIIGGADSTKLTDNNIGVNNVGGKLKIQLAKDINLGEAGSVRFVPESAPLDENGQPTVPVTGLDKNGLTIAGTTTDKDGTTQVPTTTTIGADKIVVNGQDGQDGKPGTGVVIGKQGVTPSIEQADGTIKPGETQTGNYVTGLDNTEWNPEEKGIVESRAATEGQLKDAVDGIAKGTGENATGGFGLTADNQVDGKPVEVRQDLGKTIQIAGDGQNISTTADPTSGKITVGLTNDLSIGGPAGKDGKDGINGSIGVNGADGKSGVGINGKDGISIKGADGKNGVTIYAKDGKDGEDGVPGSEGHIGLTGAPGKDGQPGSSADIHVIRGAAGVDGVTGQNGKDGLTRIVYEDEAGTTHQVATLEDGQKYAGDNGQGVGNEANIIKKHLNEQLDIIGGADSTKLTDKNIGVNNVDGKLKVQLAKDVNLGEVGSVRFMPENTPLDKNGQATVPVTGLDKDGLTIAGTTTDKDGTTQVPTTTKIGADKIVVNGQEGKDGNPGTGVVIGKQGVTPSIEQADGTTKLGEAQTGNYVTGLDNTKWTPSEGIVESRAATEGQLKDAVDGIAKGTGENATGGFGLTADNQVDGKPVEVRQDLGKTIQIAGDGQNISTTADPTSGKITVGLTNDLSIGGPAGKDGQNGKDGVDGKIGVNGADGKSGVGIDGKNGISIKGADGKNGITIYAKDGKDGEDGVPGSEGHIGLTGAPGKDGQPGSSADIHVIRGAAGVDGVTGQNGKDGLTRIVYEDEAGTPHQVATLEDGQKYAGDNGQGVGNEGNIIKKHLNEQLDIVGGADSAKLTDKNIGVNNVDGKLKVQLAKDINLGEAGSVRFMPENTPLDEKGQPTAPVTGLNKDGLIVVGTTAGEDGTTQVPTTTKIGADKIVVNGQEGKDGNPATGVVIGKQDVTPSIKQADGTTKPGEAQTGNYVTGLDNTKWNPEEKGIVESRAATEGQLKDAVDGIAKGTGENAIGGFGLTADNQVDGKPVEVRQDLGKTIQIAGDGQNIFTTADPTSGKITIGLTNDLSIGGPAGKDGQAGQDGKDGINGNIGVNGADGKSGVGINGKDGISIKGADGKNGVTIYAKDGKDGEDGVPGSEGHIGLTGAPGKDGQPGSSADIHVIRGAAGVDGVTGQNGKDGLTRIVYEDEAGTTHQVATLEDGQKYAGDNGQGVGNEANIIKKHLNEQLDIIGGADSTKLTDKNIGVNNVDGKLKVQLAQNIDLGAKGSLEAGDVKVGFHEGNLTTVSGNPVKAGQYVTGLSNIDWDIKNPDIVSGRAATENQLKTVSDAIKGVIDGTGENATGGFGLTGDDGKELKQDLGKTIKVVGGITSSDTAESDASGVSNITTRVNGSALEISLNKDVLLGSEGSVTAGETFIDKAGVDTNKVNTGEVAIKESDIKITKDGMNAGNKQITNLASGATGKDENDKPVYGNDTNAANIGDVKELVGQVDKKIAGGRGFAGDSGMTTVGLGQNLVVKGGIADEAKLADNNIGIIAKDGSLNVKLAKDLTNLNSVTIGDKEGDHTSITSDGIAISGGPTFTRNQIDAADNKITGVAKGDINEKSTDAINGGQLFEELGKRDQAIDGLGGAVNKLGNQINRVGAGAAALAALHPLDFDPDDKWDVAAGYGHYKGANAAAIGAYYRPNEDTMVSLGGSIGGGENMVNVGVSLKLGQGNNVSRGRVAMAKEMKDMRKEIEDLRSALVAVSEGRRLDPTKTKLFPDIPKNHWAYNELAILAGNDIVIGYPDGNFDGNRMMTRYEFAMIIYREMMRGAQISDRLFDEFELELERIRVDVIAKDKDGNPTIERVRVIPGRG